MTPKIRIICIDNRNTSIIDDHNMSYNLFINVLILYCIKSRYGIIMLFLYYFIYKVIRNLIYITTIQKTVVK